MTDAIRHRVFEPFFTTKEWGAVRGWDWPRSTESLSRVADNLGFERARSRYYLRHLFAKGRWKPHRFRPGRAGEYPRGTETILLLEDEDSLRQVTCECLTASGYNVIQAGRGNSALELAAQYPGPIHLVISDVVMPEMSGPMAVSKLRISHPELQALYMSGYAETPVVQELIAEGALLLQKPLTRMTLLTKVDEMLHSSANTSAKISLPRSRTAWLRTLLSRL